MLLKWLVTGVLMMSVMTCHAAAQSVPELLEKGIYNQETVGDLDHAIEIYRQIVSSTPADHGYAAQAQYRLAQCLLQKGAEAEAAKEFKKVIQSYPEEKDLVERSRDSLLPLAHYLKPDFYDSLLGFSFTSTSPELLPFHSNRGDDGSSLMVSSADHSGYGWSLTVRRSKMPPGSTVRELQDRLQALSEEFIKESVSCCRVRPDSVSKRELKGLQVLSFVMDKIYPSLPNAHPILEYYAWVESGKTEVQLKVQMSEQDLARNLTIIEQILELMRMP